MKVIDLLNKIANGEEVPKRIRFGHSDYHFNESNGFYYDDWGNSLYKDMRDATSHLNDEVEILDEEDEFIDIKEFCTKYNLEYIDYKNIDVLKNHLNKDFQTIFDTLDVLIKNQKKIIERLDKNE